MLAGSRSWMQSITCCIHIVNPTASFSVQCCHNSFWIISAAMGSQSPWTWCDHIVSSSGHLLNIFPECPSFLRMCQIQHHIYFRFFLSNVAKKSSLSAFYSTKTYRKAQYLQCFCWCLQILLSLLKFETQCCHLFVVQCSPCPSSLVGPKSVKLSTSCYHAVSLALSISSFLLLIFSHLHFWEYSFNRTTETWSSASHFPDTWKRESWTHTSLQSETLKIAVAWEQRSSTMFCLGKGCIWKCIWLGHKQSPWLHRQDISGKLSDTWRNSKPDLRSTKTAPSVLDSRWKVSTAEPLILLWTALRHFWRQLPLRPLEEICTIERDTD